MADTVSVSALGECMYALHLGFGMEPVSPKHRSHLSKNLPNVYVL
jgi:hypothetical protein